MPQLVLGSSSPFRAELLQKLGLPFACCSPTVDESAHPGETVQARVTRLAEAKARALAGSHPDSLIIGADQLAALAGSVFGKPGNRANAIAQLRAASGRIVTFHTGLCLLNSNSGRAQLACEPFRVHFRQLDTAQIKRYVDKEQPFACAGSFKSEAYGITLCSRLCGDDPNTLVGLPLIRLIAMLGEEGIFLP